MTNDKIFLALFVFCATFGSTNPRLFPPHSKVAFCVQSPDVAQQSLTTATAQRLQSIGRSKTDPGNQAAENGSPTGQNGTVPTKCLHAQSSLQRSPPSLSIAGEKKTELTVSFSE